MRQLLANFYLELLTCQDQGFRVRNQSLYAQVRNALASELEEDEETVQNIFERMARGTSK